MSLEFLGRKLGMTQIFTDTGDCIPVTVLSMGPCVVVQKKTEDNDGYTAVQFGFEDMKDKHTTRPMKGHFAKANVTPQRFLFECRLSSDEAAPLEVGQSVAFAPHFEGVKKVDVSGLTKGRGFTGVVKRWNFVTVKSSHGTHEVFRHGGSVAAGSYPGRIFPGKRMAGRYGNENVTQLGLRVEKLDADQNLLYVRGAVPGHTNAIVRVRTTNRA